IDKTEKLYYLASSHYKLVEFDYSSDLFKKVKASANKNLSGSAGFYLGLIQYQRENFNAAKVEFEFVLDNSVDPELDKQAEVYLERIQQDLQFLEQKKKPYYANASVGIQQDSNILLQPDGTSSSATAADDGGLRFQLMGSLEYKAKQTKIDEWSLKSTLVYYYSVDDEFTQADPLDVTVSAAYKKNSSISGKSYRWELEPGIETLYMDVDQEGSRENILNAVFLNWKNSIVMSERLISNYNFQIYVNDSKIDASTSDDDASSIKYTFTYNNIYFIDREKGKILISDLGYLINDADGKNYAHTRFDLALNYIQPITLWDLTLSAKLAYNQSDYDSDDNRVDKNTSFNLTFIRSINDWLGCNASLGYIDNKSNVDTREYDKYTIGANVTGKWNF
ncbi:MAG: outer membrane beta-barrel protein, partial [Bdellovibrionales bacterium]|nr:outer membrane beta-barrel protein [Bdellovibrionales bacterium]